MPSPAADLIVLDTLDVWSEPSNRSLNLAAPAL
jgi:hypothetical protein